MKKYDLRIGNILNYTTAEGDIQTCIVDWQYLEWITEDENGFNLIHDGIELTEEILLKCGYILTNPNTMCFQKPMSQTLYLTDNGVTMSTGIPMNYLHELQNRVKSVEGKELEIKL